MGRQKGDANRSKNRPSSSSTAASLLPTSTGLSVGFGGYLGSSRVDAIDDQEKDQQWDVDGEAALHLRRLSKKDATTRIKALKALLNIFNDWPASELCQLLPNWIFEYKRLIQDDSQQVRENTHNAMSAIAASVGRGLAPHLRTVMGAWWVSQFDPVREVSAAAQRSFQVAFQGQSKRLEALLYGANDIVTYIDGLLRLSPQMISEKSTPIEESTKKYELAISSALLALAAFLDILLHTKMLASSQSDELTEVEKGTSNEKRNPDKSRDVECIAATLCLNHKFFRDFAKSKSSQVRCASYQALRALAKNVPAILSPKDLDSVSVVVLGSFSDKDPVCHVALWDMVIGVTKQCPEIWSTSSASKIAFPRLLAFLRHATYGSAKVSYPCLLPLLSLLPVQTVKPATEFFREFFVSLWEGYKGRSLVADDEMSFLEAVKECFIWIINNAERFAAYERAETIQSFMMENVLLELLWKGYVFSGVCVHGTLVKKYGKESQIGSRIITEERYSAQFLENLRICISDMISILSDKSKELLCSFWTRFHDVCFEAVSIETGDSESIPSQGCTLRITKFMSDLGERSLSNDSQKAWLLSQVVRPLVAKIYHTVKATEYPDAVRLLAKIVSVYGPLSFPVTDLCKTEPVNEECNLEDEEEKSLLSISTFVRSELIPWCLDGSKSSCNEKVDLLLSFFEDTRLRTEWSLVLSFALQAGNGADEMSCNKVDVLAILLENFRLRFWDSEEIDYKGDASSLLVCWDLSGLDAVAVVIAGSPLLSDDSSLRFLRNVLGGFKENVVPPLVQRGTVESIFKILLQRMLHALLNSEHDWAHYAASSILMPDLDLSHPAVQYEKALVLACAAAQVVCGSIFTLQNVNNSDVVSKVVASLFCICWAYNSLSNYQEHIDCGIGDSSHRESSSESEEDDFTHHNVVPLLNSTQSEEISNMVTAISLVLCSGFCKRLIATTRFRILQMLIQCVHHAVCEGGTDTLETMHACGKWVLALMNQLCTNAEDTQQLLDVLLEPTEVWPLFNRTPLQTNKIPMLLKDHDGYLAKEPGHEQFAAFVSKVALFIGWEKLVVPSMLLIPNGSQIAGKGKDVSPEEQCRIWLLIEMLCTWRWPGGSAVESVLPFLVSCTRSIAKNLGENIVISVVSSLFSSAVSKAWALEFNNKFWMGLNENIEDVEDPYLRALLACLSKMSAGGNTEFAQNTFKMLIIEQGFLEDTFSDGRSKVLPFVLSILVPILRKGQEGSSSDVLNMGTSVPFEVVVCKWMDVAMSSPPSSSSSGAISDTWQLLQVIVACFPLHPAGGLAAILAADSAQTTPKETELLLDVLKKEVSDGAVAGFVAHVAKQHASPQKGGERDDIRLTHQEILAKLVTASVAYCWKDFKFDEWAVILGHLRAWLEAALLNAERFLQVVTDTFKEVESNNTRESSGSTLVDKVTVEIERAGCLKSDLSWTAVVLLSLIQALENSTLSDASSSLEALEMSDWKKVKQRVLSYVLRVFFATGMAESVALDWSAGESAGKAVAASRLPDLHFWEDVSEIVMSISNEERVEMARHLNIWTVGKDAVRALYALMFSSYAIGGLQHAAFSFLTGDPFQTSAVTYNDQSLQEDRAKEESVHTGLQATPSSSAKSLRHELALVLETMPTNIFETSLVSPVRVNYFLAWAVLLSHLRSVSVSSQEGEQLVQYIQDKSLSSTLLDSIFQHIPLRTESGSLSRRRTSSGMWQAEVDRVGEAARRSCTLGSVSFAIEGLWPLEEGTMSVLAASLYGSMLKVLPACVRVWFTALRDRSAASLVEGFTTKYCSPLLVAEEFSQVHKSAIADDNLTIKANQSVGEVTVVYKKEEAGMDMLIRLPNSYPLRAVNIDCTRQLGISETRLRKWLLSMAAFLRNQNGAVAEAIQIWKQNVDGEFEGVEECPICYSIIHTANHSLPRLACRTCKHKFHAACLYKWFSTSHKSTCPLCQTPF